MTKQKKSRMSQIITERQKSESSWKKKKKSMLTSDRLPDDVLIDILSRLPPKSLIRFRCVSKFWSSTITNPFFITTHLNQAKSLSNGYLLYTRLPVEFLCGKELCAVVYNRDPTLTQVSKYEIPFSGSRILGICNGLFCLGSHRVLNLWNPCIRKFKKVLDGTCFTRHCRHIALGLAYCSQNYDYKIVRMVCFEGLNGEGKVIPAVAEIYTLSRDSWRKGIGISVESLNRFEPNGSIDRIDESPCVFFNGALHSIAYIGNYKFILSFDVNDETFREIMLPNDYLNGVHLQFEKLVVFKGSLSLIVFVQAEDEEGDIFHIWVMREYGVVKSWTKKSVPMEKVGQFIGCTDNGELLIKKIGTGLVLFDPEGRNEENLGIKNATWAAYTTNFLESLVLFDGVNV